jgi:hypothetical protein
MESTRIVRWSNSEGDRTLEQVQGLFDGATPRGDRTLEQVQRSKSRTSSRTTHSVPRERENPESLHRSVVIAFKTKDELKYFMKQKIKTNFLVYTVRRFRRKAGAKKQSSQQAALALPAATDDPQKS